MSKNPKPAIRHKSAEVRFWGVRGSIPVPGPQTVRFGGNTSCVEVRADRQIIILDAGSGLHPLGVSLVEEARGRPLDLTILITHLHWDHIQGFPFFAPGCGDQNRIRIHGFSNARGGLHAAFAGQMEAPYFPLALSQMSAGIAFEQLDSDAFQIGNIRVTACRTNHPGLCHGYRLDTSAGSICYVPDHEADGAEPCPGSAEVANLIRGADLVILDSQYTAEEYRVRMGWGHSSMEDAVRVAHDARAKHLVMFHHDPSHDDQFLDRMLESARHMAAGSGMHVASAREGERITLPVKSS